MALRNARDAKLLKKAKGNTPPAVTDSTLSIAMTKNLMTARVLGNFVNLTNSREHWAVRHKRLKAQKLAAKALVLQWRQKFKLDEIKGFFLVWLVRTGPQKIDSDSIGTTFKGVQDGLAEGIGIDDGDGRWTWRYGQKKSSQTGVLITLLVVPGKRVSCD